MIDREEKNNISYSLHLFQTKLIENDSYWDINSKGKKNN